MTTVHRVLFVTRAPFISGAETSLLHLLKGLSRTGHEVHVVCGREGPVRDLYASNGIATTVVPLAMTDKLHPLRFWKCVRGLQAIMRRQDITLIHANDLPSYQAASLAAHNLGLPRVCHARFLIEGPDAQWFLKYGVERVIAVSPYLKDHLETQCPAGFADKTTAILDGLDVGSAFTAADRHAARGALGLPPHATVFLLAGQFTSVKGIADILDAIPLFRRASPGPAVFCLVGDDLAGHGAYRREMMERAHRTAGDADIRFPGFQRDVKPWTAAADCVVVPSRVDPLGMTVMESMAGGRVVIGTRVGGIPEMITPGQTGYLVEPMAPAALAAAMVQVAADPARRVDMERRAALRATELFDLDHYVRRIVQVYDEVTARRVSP